MLRSVLSLIFVFCFFAIACNNKDSGNDKNSVDEETTRRDQENLDRLIEQITKEQKTNGPPDDDTNPDQEDQKSADPFTSFSLNVPETGVSIGVLPKGSFVLKEVVTLFSQEENSIQGGVHLHFKTFDPPPQDEWIHLLPLDYRSSKYSVKKEVARYKAEGFIDWGSFDRTAYEFHPDIVVDLPLSINIDETGLIFSKIVNVYTEFETWSEDSQEIEIGFRLTRSSSVSIEKMFQPNHFHDGTFTAKMYLDEIKSFGVITHENHRIELFVDIQHDTSSRKIKLIYEKMN